MAVGRTWINLAVEDEDRRSQIAVYSWLNMTEDLVAKIERVERAHSCGQYSERHQ